MLNLNLGSTKGQLATDIANVLKLRKLFFKGTISKKQKKLLLESLNNISSAVKGKCGLEDGFFPVNLGNGKPRFDLFKSLVNNQLMKGDRVLPTKINGKPVLYKKFIEIFEEKTDEIDYAGIDGNLAPSGVCKSTGLNVSPEKMNAPMYTVLRTYYYAKIAQELTGMMTGAFKSYLKEEIQGEKATDETRLLFIHEKFGQAGVDLYNNVKGGKKSATSHHWNADSNSSFSTAGNSQGSASGLSSLNDGEPDYSYINTVEQLKAAISNSNEVDDIAGLLGYALENLQKFGLSNNTERGFRSIIANIGGDFGKNHRIGFHKDQIRKAFTWE